MPRARSSQLHDIRELGTNQDRIVRLESNYESLRSELGSVHEAVDDIGDRLDREFTRIRDASKPNYAIWVALAGVLLTMFSVIGAAAYVPVWITTNNINDKAQTALNIAYENKNVNAQQETSFREVETQFRGISKEIQTQVTQNSKDNDAQTARLEALERHNLYKAQRLSRIEQRLNDMNGKDQGMAPFPEPNLNDQ